MTKFIVNNMTDVLQSYINFILEITIVELT